MKANKDKVYLGRQPIFDRQQNLVAYELLYRSGDVAEARVTNDAAATAEVIRRSFKRFGIETVLGDCAGFFNVDAEMLFSRRIDALPTARVVLELLETVVITPALVARCRELKERGFRLALDDFSAYHDCYEPLLEIVDIIKIDLPLLDQAALATLVRRLKPYPGKLLAEKVETWARVNECMALGFEFFQGFVLARPSVLIS
ncbi:MAG: signal transduction protein [Proteobacteria bacterium]|nr:signal transduction protein [Pseudomonadota bacterium]